MFLLSFVDCRFYRQSNRKSLYPDMEKKLFQHIAKKRATGAPISRKYIQVIAKYYSKKLNIQRFVGK